MRFERSWKCAVKPQYSYTIAFAHSIGFNQSSVMCRLDIDIETIPHKNGIYGQINGNQLRTTSTRYARKT